MSKKYIYLKQALHHPDELSCSQLFIREAATYLEELEIIKNPFQLLQFEDLRLLISKSLPLQNLLTANLPPQGHHGYLWQGETLPDILKLLQTSAGISSCLIFQKNSDPVPSILTTPYSRLKQQLEIYNWVIYIIPTYNQIRRYLESRSSGVSTEIDIDRFCRELWREFEQGQKNNYIYEMDIPVHINCPRKEWQALTLNILGTNSEKALYIPFAGDGSIIHDAILSGKKVIHLFDTALIKKVLEEKSIISHFDPAHYNKAISVLVSQIRLLSTINSNSQKDLFTDDAEQRFLSFWESEKNRYHEQKMKWLAIDLFKFLTIVHFLIKNQLVSREKQINDFIFAMLIRWTDQIINRKKITDPISNFLDFIRCQYLEYYRLAKIMELAPGKSWQVKGYFSKLLDSVQVPIGCIFIDFENNTSIIKELNKLQDIFYPESNQEYLPEDISSFPRVEEGADAWIRMINRQDAQYLFLGNYGQNVITCLMASAQQEEAARCLKYWNSIGAQIKEFGMLLSKGGKLAIVLKPFFIKNLSHKEELPIQKIVSEMINNQDELKNYQIFHEAEVLYKDKQNHQNRRIVLFLEVL